MPFACGCGRCEYCRAGDTQVCPDQTQPGFTGPGSFAERVAIHAADTNLVALPDGVDAVTAASLGCRFATAYRALTGHARLRPGEWLAVHGCGGVGLSAVHIGVALGARVVAVDVAGPARRRARDLGAEHTILSATNTDPAPDIHDLTGGGRRCPSTRSARPPRWPVGCGACAGAGGTCRSGCSWGPMPRRRCMGLVIARELEIYGSHGMAARDYPAMLAQVADGTLRPGLLVGEVIGLEQAGAALAAMDGPASGAGMTVIVPAPEGPGVIGRPG